MPINKPLSQAECQDRFKEDLLQQEVATASLKEYLAQRRLWIKSFFQWSPGMYGISNWRMPPQNGDEAKGKAVYSANIGWALLPTRSTKLGLHDSHRRQRTGRCYAAVFLNCSVLSSWAPIPFWGEEVQEQITARQRVWGHNGSLCLVFGTPWIKKDHITGSDVHVHIPGPTGLVTQ